MQRKTLNPLWGISSDQLELELAYHLCRRCGYVTLYPRFDEGECHEHSRLARRPSREAFGKRAQIYRARRDFILERLDPSRLETIIEVGAAHGDFLRLMPASARRIGIEPSLACNQTSADLEFLSCSLEEVTQEYPELVGSGDLVAASNVLEHVVQPRDFVRRLLELTRPGGHLFLEVPSLEGLARVPRPIFQSLHMGHISQFTVEVLDQVCVGQGLERVEAAVVVEHDYPVIRALYSRSERRSRIGKHFAAHREALDAWTRHAKDALLEEVARTAEGLVDIWGCGDDLFAILSSLTEEDLERVRRRAKLVDMSQGKQGKTMHGMQIEAPDSLGPGAVDVVLVTSKSDIIQADITATAEQRFPVARTVCLYGDETRGGAPLQVKPAT